MGEQRCERLAAVPSGVGFLDYIRGAWLSTLCHDFALGSADLVLHSSFQKERFFMQRDSTCGFLSCFFPKALLAATTTCACMCVALTPMHVVRTLLPLLWQRTHVHAVCCC